LAERRRESIAAPPRPAVPPVADRPPLGREPPRRAGRPALPRDVRRRGAGAAALWRAQNDPSFRPSSRDELVRLLKIDGFKVERARAYEILRDVRGDHGGERVTDANAAAAESPEVD
jgi:hypothetical protein